MVEDYKTSNENTEAPKVGSFQYELEIRLAKVVSESQQWTPGTRPPALKKALDDVMEFVMGRGQNETPAPHTETFVVGPVLAGAHMSVSVVVAGRIVSITDNNGNVWKGQQETAVCALHGVKGCLWCPVPQKAGGSES